jgi:hypothetical protein
MVEMQSGDGPPTSVVPPADRNLLAEAKLHTILEESHCGLGFSATF